MRRSSILDGVLDSLKSLRARVNADDRDRLDAHAEFVRTVETRLAGDTTGVQAAMSCERPDEASVPHVVPSNYEEYLALGGRSSEWERGAQDNVTVPHQIENLVMALACDITRVCVMPFQPDPTFAYAFSGTSPFSSTDSWHQEIHGANVIDSGNSTRAENLHTAHKEMSKFFTLLVQRLAAVQDTDGSRLLDNTLVLWSSDLGYGSEHTVFNIPVVLAGLGSEFSKGQGRHVVEDRRTLGDLYAQMLRMLGGTDMTFGATGTLGSLASSKGVGDLLTEYGMSGHINQSTPLHMGTLDL